MSYDLLVIASDAQSVTNYSHEDFVGLDGKHGMSAQDWRDMVDAKAPRWSVNNTEMIFPAMDNYFGNNRRLTITPEEKQAYFRARANDDLKFLNGIFLADFCIRRGYSVEVINRLPEDYSSLAEELAKGPRVVAISSTFIPNRRRITEIARWIKDRDKDVKVVVGGPLVRYSHMIVEKRPELRDNPLIDAIYFFQKSDVEPDPVIDALVVDVRGEQTLCKILDRVRKGQDIQDLPNVAYYDSSHRLKVNPLEPEKLDETQWTVDWKNLPERFLGPTVAVRGSLGCPLRCKFCSFVVLYPEWEMKSVDFLRDELRQIASRGFIKNICFSDDNVFLRRSDVDRYSKMMAEENLPLGWNGYVRVDSISETNVEWLADSGCKGMSLGIESGDTDVLKHMRKRQKPERILKAIDLVNNKGISTASSFIVGFPGETEESVTNTIDLINQFSETGDGINFYTAWVFTAIPLTPADNEREKWNMKGHLIDWEHDGMNVGDAHRQVQRFHKEVHQGAYLHYPYDEFGMFNFPGGREKCRDALRLRNGLAVMDEYGVEKFRGRDREQTLVELEDAMRRPAEVGAEVTPAEGQSEVPTDTVDGSTVQFHGG